MNKRMVAFAMFSVLLAGGCTGTKEQTGQVVGGVVGGYLGSTIGKGSGNLAATAAGAVIGALVGGAIGSNMDEMDRMQAHRALETAPTGNTVSWVNPDSGTAYAVTPTRTYETAGGPCREYTTEANIGGRIEHVYGTACRQADGSWQIVN